MGDSRPMPRYRCHKEVFALKIKAIKRFPGGATITPADEGHAPFVTTAGFMIRHDPQVGGYYVVYDDGYHSYSPADAFEGGYTLIKAA